MVDLTTRRGARVEFLEPERGPRPIEAIGNDPCAGVPAMLPKVRERMVEQPAPDVVLDTVDRCLERAGRGTLLTAFYRRAVDDHPDEVRYRHRLASAFVGLGDVPEALRLVAQVLAADPDYAPSLFLKGLLLGSRPPAERTQDVLRQAYAAWSRLLEVDPTHKGFGTVDTDQVRARVAQWRRTLEKDTP